MNDSEEIGRPRYERLTLPQRTNSAEDTRPPLRRAILLGASNVTLGFPILLQQLRRRQTGPLDVFAAHGHGRSYGNWSRALGRELPGILQSGLWKALEDFENRFSEFETLADRKRSLLTSPGSSVESLQQHSAALITDVGNDLVYGVATDVLISWVETVLERIGHRCAEVILVLPPFESIQQLEVPRFEFFRKLLFPSHQAELSTLRDQVEQLCAGLVDLAERKGVQIAVPHHEWYGIDPIHIRWSHRSAAWRDVLSLWPQFPPVADDPVRWPWRSIRDWMAKPEVRRTKKGEIETPQPALIDGDFRVHLF